jgi:hypothetical protein
MTFVCARRALGSIAATTTATPQIADVIRDRRLVVRVLSVIEEKRRINYSFVGASGSAFVLEEPNSMSTFTERL